MIVEEEPEIKRRSASVSRRTSHGRLDELPIVDLTKYRLPNLLENKLRRIAMREQKSRNPKVIPARIIFANFSKPQLRSLTKAAVVESKEKGPRKTKKKKKVNRLNVLPGPMKPNAKPLPARRGRPSIAVLSLTEEPMSRENLESAKRSNVNLDQDYRPLSAHLRSGSGKRPPSPKRVGPSALSKASNANVAEVGSMFLPTKESKRTSIGERQRVSVGDSNEPNVRWRAPIRIRRKRDLGPRPILPHPHPDTIKALQEVDNIIQAFARKHLHMDKKVLEKALVHPEDIFIAVPKPSEMMEHFKIEKEVVAPRFSLISAKRRASIAPFKGDAFKGDETPKSEPLPSLQPPRRKMTPKSGLHMATLMVKPFKPVTPSANNMEPYKKETNTFVPRVHSWWTPKEFKDLKTSYTQKVKAGPNQKVFERHYISQAVHHPKLSEIAAKTSKHSNVPSKAVVPKAPMSDGSFMDQADQAMQITSIGEPMSLPRIRNGRMTPIRPRSATSHSSVFDKDENVLDRFENPPAASNPYRLPRRRAVSETRPSPLDRPRASSSRGTTMSMFSELSAMMHSRQSSFVPSERVIYSQQSFANVKTNVLL